MTPDDQVDEDEAAATDADRWRDESQGEDLDGVDEELAEIERGDYAFTGGCWS